MPAALAAEIASFFLYWLFLNSGKYRQRMFATQQAMWTKPPSLPRERPAPTERIRAMHLISRVHPPRYFLTTTPPRMVMISGMPDPAACGAKYSTSQAASDAMQTPSTTYIR